MKSILYLSEVTEVFSDNDIDELVSLSASKNKQLGVTGYLSFSGNRFVQYLEGESPVVIELLDTIRNDPRHRFINEIELNYQTERMFSSWSMRLITQKELTSVNLPNYVEQNMLFLSGISVDKQRCIENLWRQIKTIAAIQETKNLLSNKNSASHRI